MPGQPCFISPPHSIQSLEKVLKLIRLTAALFAALTLVACATKPPEPAVDFAPDYNFSQPKTIGF